ncbi:MAG: alpha-N-acetylglucosaminidase [Candidatus Omnitrophota bacterium]|jgi:alpha-N-acetylglucosaminidase|nr:MAG: alpha-N-acetylglucosaminidase [Candidatus Omnitrophota bacterium]
MLKRRKTLLNSFIVITLLLVFGANAQGEARDNPSPESSVIAAQGVIQRLIPAHAKQFDLAVISPDDGRDVFEIESREGNIILRGNNGVSLCSALHWYLRYNCHTNISWNGIQLDLPETLPAVPQKIRQVSPHRYRYFFNYCCFGYSLPWWDWEQWEFMIDWMALNGINMPLAVTGQEATWQKVMRQLDLGEDAVRQFLAGPPYLPFGWMGCLDGWGGPLPQNWIDRHEELQRKILARERELGMTPVIQGFTGHVPAAIRKKFPDAKLHKIQWIEWNTLFIDPLDPLFRQIGKLFLDQQRQDFGTDHLYAADTFIEMSPPSNDPAFLNNMGKSLISTLTEADPDAIWVMQGWIFYNNAKFWQPPQSKAFLAGVPDDRMILLDLYCDVAPVWKKTEAFYGKPWIWCILQNFGNTISLSGPLPRINEELFQSMSDPARGKLSGIGMIQEGLDYNPVVFEFMTEMTWRDKPVDLSRWIADYATRRYGQPLDSAQKAWEFMQNSVYDKTHSPNSIYTSRPQYSNDPPKPVSVSGDLLSAWEQLLLCADALQKSDTYRFDVVNVTRQVLSDFARIIYTQSMTAYQKNDVKQFKKSCQRFLEILDDLDEVLATRQEFLLGKWIADARRWGTTETDQQLFEWNARNVITLWGDAKSALHDYARKEWSGLISEFYRNRWKLFFDQLEQSLPERKDFDNDAFTQMIQMWENAWTRRHDSYPDQPSGDSVDIAIRLFKKYRSELGA